MTIIIAKSTSLATHVQANVVWPEMHAVRPTCPPEPREHHGEALCQKFMALNPREDVSKTLAFTSKITGTGFAAG